MRGPPNEDFRVAARPAREGRLGAVDGFDDTAADPPWVGGSQKPARRAEDVSSPPPMETLEGSLRRGPNYLYSFASFSDSRARIIASRPTAVNVVPHDM